MMVRVGNGNYVNTRLILSILKSDNAPSKRRKKNAAQHNCLDDATGGKPTRSLLTVWKSEQIVQCSPSTDSLAFRINKSIKNRQVDEETLF
jgi:extracellular matrix regulatory protein A